MKRIIFFLTLLLTVRLTAVQAKIAYQLGTSEQFVGRALHDMARRDDVVVATKFLPRTEEEIQQGIDGRQHVLNNIDSSLQHLGMDYVDLYIYHIWDYLGC